MKIAFYITGHGFGHAMRAVTVMKALRQRDPSLHFFVRTTAPAALLQREIDPPVHITSVQTDTGCVERGILYTDEEKTVERARAFYKRADEVIEKEAAFLREQRIDLVLFDVPPAAAEIAARAGVSSIAIANFTWEHIYAAYSGLEDIVEQISAWYAKTSLALEVPLGHELTVFPRCEPVPIIARKSEANAVSLRQELGLDESDLPVLAALKGDELAGRPLQCDDPRVRFFTFAELEGPRVVRLGEGWQTRFHDVLAACDVVLSKPGYGIVSECIANRRPLLHLPREGFRETGYLLRAMDALLPHAAVALEDVQQGRFGGLIDSLAFSDFDWPDIGTDGASVCAEKILSFADENPAR